MEKIKVLIADDHQLFAKLISTLLISAKGVDIVGIAPDGEKAIEIIENGNVDILLLDINMPKMDGLQTMKRLVERHPNLKIIILSSHNEAWLIQKTLKSGASGYLTKSAEDQEVLEAIMTVHKGGSYCSKDSLQSIVDNITNKKPEIDQSDLYKSLTKREKEVLQLITKEYNSNEIGDRLNISSRTVETHRKNILQKLGVKNTVGLMKVAMKANLIDEEKSE